MLSLRECNQTGTLKFFIGKDAVNNPQRHSAFSNFYREKAELQAAEDEFCKLEVPVLGTHKHVEDLVLELRDNPSCTKQSLQESIRQGLAYSQDDLEHAVRTVIQMGFMLDCTLTKNFSRIYCLRNHVPQRWKLEQSFEDFITSSLPKQKAGTLAPYEYRDMISAAELRKRCKVVLQRTDNIADHLQYNPDGRILKIFHQMEYLRTQLRRYPAPLVATELKDNLKLGTLPPQLILETIESFYGLLFPIVIATDGPSRRLLKRLVEKDGFDHRTLEEIEEHSDWIPDDFKYHYWGPRLQKLHELSQQPIMESTWLSFMDRYTKEQNALILAIAGLLLSALFGFLGFIVGVVQLGIAVATWKQPVPNGS